MKLKELYEFIDKFGEDAVFKTKSGSKKCPAHKLKEYIAEAIKYETNKSNDLQIMAGFDEAIIGTATQANKEIVVYDKELIFKRLSEWMPEDDVEEYFEYNIACAYVGETTPLIFTKGTIDEITKMDMGIS